MEKTWKELYESLVKYVEDHESIRIKPTSISMTNSDDRDGFYNLFQEVRNSFVEEVLGDKLVKFNSLKDLWITDSNKFKETLNLEKIEVPYEMQQLIDTPLTELSKLIYNSLFKVFQGNSTIDVFEQESQEVIVKEINNSYSLLYKWWILLRTIMYLEPEKLYAQEYQIPESINGVAITYRYEYERNFEVVNKLFFGEYRIISFAEPFVAFYSKKFKTNFSVVVNDQEATWINKQKDFDNKWLSLDEIKSKYGVDDIYPYLTLYQSKNMYNLAMARDMFWMSQPAVNIDVKPLSTEDITSNIKSAKRHGITVQPTKGSILICDVDSEMDASASDVSKEELVVVNPTIAYTHLTASNALQEAIDSRPDMGEIGKPSNLVVDEFDKDNVIDVTDDAFAETISSQVNSNSENTFDEIADAVETVETEPVEESSEDVAEEGSEEVAEDNADEMVSSEETTGEEAVEETPETSVTYFVPSGKQGFYSIDSLPEKQMVKLVDFDDTEYVAKLTDIKVANVVTDTTVYEKYLEDVLADFLPVE